MAVRRRLLVLASRKSIAEMDAFKIAAFDRQIAGLGRARANNHGVEFHAGDLLAPGRMQPSRLLCSCEK